MRGEHSICLSFLFLVQGSSPHARGTLERSPHAVLGWGIIPACAGNTLWKRRVAAVTRDHPRMRGEHRGAKTNPAQAQGSSPHARGTPIRSECALSRPGIIPACAGNTRCRLAALIYQRDHPRMRGEHTVNRHALMLHAGSSPHARGTRTGLHLASRHAGIIPACAGNTDLIDMATHKSWDHPRMRGEHSQCSKDLTGAPGSSPHARGTHISVSLYIGDVGIIPACAGNTGYL